MAILHARGQLTPGQTFKHESPIGSVFDARIESTTHVGDYPAVVPSVAGRAWITSFNQLVLDPSDPFPHGFVVGRAWEPAI
jgi:proline racemase